MNRIAIAVLAATGLTALVMSGATVVRAQPSAHGAESDLPSAADLKVFTDRRVDLVKAALQLTPAQTKYWPAIEEAIHARATARYERLKKLAALASDDQERSPLDLLRVRADNLASRAASLKKLVDAWQPLYETLEPAQRIRLRVLAMFVLREMRNAAESRRWQSNDDDEGDEW